MGALQDILNKKAALSAEVQANPNRFANPYSVLDGLEGAGATTIELPETVAAVARTIPPILSNLSDYVLHTELGDELFTFSRVQTEELNRTLVATKEHVISALTPMQAALASLEERMKQRQKVVILAADRPQVELETIVHQQFEPILKRIAAGCHVMLVGPTQCGKTTLAAQIATALDLPFSANSMSAGTKESDLLGWLLPTGASGNFEYHAAPFVTTYERGGLQLFDEVDASDANLLLMANMALANKRMFIPHRLGNAEVLMHNWFRCIACANTWGTGADAQYVGRNQLDESTLARFVKIAVDYDPMLEHALYDPEAVKIGHMIRANLRKHRLRRVLTTKTLDNWTICLAAGIPLTECISDYLLGWTQEEQRLAMEKDERIVQQVATQAIQAAAIQAARPAPTPRTVTPQRFPRPTANKAVATGIAAEIQKDPMAAIFNIARKGGL